jgi:hypothetical protein
MHLHFHCWSRILSQLRSGRNRPVSTSQPYWVEPRRLSFKSLKYKELIKVSYAVFWLWFPFGSCGVRTALLFISSLTIFVLRVSQMHIGSRTATSSFGIFKSFTLLQIAQTFGWYIFSAWWFTQVYVWSSSGDSNLALVKWGRCVEYPSNDCDMD